MTEPTTSAGERVKVMLAWIVVLIPAVWGVAQVVSKSAALFR
ncbi:MAG TPA: hypothetical protein VF368_10565 [Gemmatimonadaceae bacterium]|jgi:hypothetical protein